MSLTFLTMLVILFSSCERDNGFTDFCDAVVLDEDTYIREYLDEILEDLDTPEPSAIDPFGHERNLIEFVVQLNDNNDCMTASILCYACIETFPNQSEILINVIDGGVSVSKIIDISTPAGSDMYFAAMHNP